MSFVNCEQAPCIPISFSSTAGENQGESRVGAGWIRWVCPQLRNCCVVNICVCGRLRSLLPLSVEKFRPHNRIFTPQCSCFWASTSSSQICTKESIANSHPLRTSSVVSLFLPFLYGYGDLSLSVCVSLSDGDLQFLPTCNNSPKYTFCKYIPPNMWMVGAQLPI